MRIHDLTDIKKYPICHAWHSQPYMNVHSNIDIKSDDIIIFNKKRYLVGNMFPVENRPKYREEASNRSLSKLPTPILEKMTNNYLIVNNEDFPFINGESRYYEFKLEEIS